ncbi:MAG: zinc metallopeptidase [Baekduia sp.]
MFIDPLFLLFAAPGLLLGLWAQMKVKSTFAKYSEVRPANGMSGADAAAAVLRSSGLPALTIEPIAGHLTDHYDPKAKTLRLSQDVGAASSLSALGVAAHEAGHAIQDANNYGPMRFRQAIVGPVMFAQGFWIFPAMGGLLLGASNQLGSALLLAGIALFGIVVLFQLVTLPVEFDASRRALASLEQQGLLLSDEVPGARAVLNAAALTYVAGFVSALGQLLYFVMMFAGNRD